MLTRVETLAKWDSSADGWIEAIEKGDVNRNLLLDEPMLRFAGDVEGKKVLDVGCGEGRFCRMLAERGAQTVGLDPTVKLIHYAADEGGNFVTGVAEALPFASEQFDLTVSYLTLIDIVDIQAAIKEQFRILRPGGRIIVANLNSFASTTTRAWFRDETGKKLHVAVVDYFDERGLVAEWGRISIYNYHRPMQTYLQAYLQAGFLLEAFEEPRPTLEAVAKHPTMIDEYRVPLFFAMSWRKPETRPRR